MDLECLGLGLVIWERILDLAEKVMIFCVKAM